MRAKTLVGGVASLTLLAALAVTAPAQAAVPSTPYAWKNAQIVGGGFIPGIVYSPSVSGLAYVRTDIGGAYRRDPGSSVWTPITDSIGWDDWGLTGIASLALDPNDGNKVYLAAGTYTNSWDPNNGAILRSGDRGASWARTTLPFKLGGNMPGRGMGERLAVDPNKGSVLYLGAPSGNGLWRSTDSGVTWAKVTAFPNPGTYAQDPNDPNGYLNDLQGVVWVTFDPRTGTAGNTTQTIYVGVADLQNTVYRSTDGGTTWTRLAGQPTGFLAHKGVLDSVNGYLYLATSDTGGPYDGGHGDVWRYATATGTWTQISPIPSSDVDNNYFGYSGLSVDRQHPGTLMVTAYSSWWPDTIIWRSTDNGATWSKIWDWTRYPSRSFRYTMDISASPWLDLKDPGARDAEVSPKLGWMTEALEINPFNSAEFLYGTGATLFGSDNLTNWDSGGTFTISVKAKGIEETSVQDLVSPPSGAPLLSALGDITGFRHDSLTTVPAATFNSNDWPTSTDIDFAESAPATVVRVGNCDVSTQKCLSYSTNGGTSWTAPAKQPTGVTGGGTVAVSADGTRYLWSPAGASVSVTANNGKTWTTSTGVPAGARVISDRVTATTFYAYANGTFYRSTNGGTSFTASAATGLPTESVRMSAVFGRAGDVWLAGGTATGAYGLWHSTDGGVTFTKLSTVEQADAVGFGKAATGATYPAIYTSAKIGGVRGIFRSDDAGATWVRINDDQHQYGWTGAVVIGDPRVYGRVYVGTNGRGIVYADPA
ncbi:xyloglucanase [Hamadaea sp. NPDC050747]|uniref:xyloglucanase n=1 Tax=Hamadaea sp. NPDC050747 TaxID=3155789 RepID=UPI0033D90735